MGCFYGWDKVWLDLRCESEIQVYTVPINKKIYECMVRIGVCSILAASPVLHLYFTYFYLSNKEEIDSQKGQTFIYTTSYYWLCLMRSLCMLSPSFSEVKGLMKLKTSCPKILFFINAAIYPIPAVHEQCFTFIHYTHSRN